MSGTSKQVAVILLLHVVHSQNRQIFPKSGAINKSKFEITNGLRPLAEINTTGQNSGFFR